MREQNIYVLDNVQIVTHIHFLRTLQRLDLCDDTYAKIPTMKTVSRQGYCSEGWSTVEKRVYTEYYI